MSYSNLYDIYRKLRELGLGEEDASEVMHLVQGLVVASVERMANTMLVPQKLFIVPKDEQ